MYGTNIKLKQGYYNYTYVLFERTGHINETRLEGNHYDTENAYDILVYYIHPTGKYDRLIGFKNLNVNSRN